MGRVEYIARDLYNVMHVGRQVGYTRILRSYITGDGPGNQLGFGPRRRCESRPGQWGKVKL